MSIASSVPNVPKPEIEPPTLTPLVKIPVKQESTTITTEPTLTKPIPPNTIADHDLRPQHIIHRSNSNSTPASNIQHATPSHKLLSIHHRKYDTLSINDMQYYLNDVPYDILSNIVIEISEQNTKIFTELDNYAMNDPSKLRIFIRGLNYDTNKESLSKAFSVFGTVMDSTVIYDKILNRSKGYGFITFKTSLEADAACAQGTLQVDGRTTQISLATPLKDRLRHSSMNHNRSTSSVEHDSRVQRFSHRSRSRSPHRFAHHSSTGDNDHRSRRRSRNTTGNRNYSSGGGYSRYSGRSSGSRYQKSSYRRNGGGRRSGGSSVDSYRSNFYKPQIQQSFAMVPSANVVAGGYTYGGVQPVSGVKGVGWGQGSTYVHPQLQQQVVQNVGGSGYVYSSVNPASVYVSSQYVQQPVYGNSGVTGFVGNGDGSGSVPVVGNSVVSGGYNAYYANVPK